MTKGDCTCSLIREGWRCRWRCCWRCHISNAPFNSCWHQMARLISPFHMPLPQNTEDQSFQLSQRRNRARDDCQVVINGPSVEDPPDSSKTFPPCPFLSEIDHPSNHSHPQFLATRPWVIWPSSTSNAAPCHRLAWIYLSRCWVAFPPISH